MTCASSSSTTITSPAASNNSNTEGKHGNQTNRAQNSPAVEGITLKIALDSTGAAADLAADKSTRFTCPQSLDLVHRLRRDSDAVLVGRKTVEVDNPSLTVRRNYSLPAGKRQPLRVVLDPLLKLAPKADQFAIFTDGLPTVVYHSVPDVDETLLDLQQSVTCVYMPEFDLERIVQHLGDEFGVRHLMVEGGPLTARLFLPLLDRVLIVKAPLCFRDPLSAGITPEVLEQTGLRYLGSSECGVDTIEYWSKPSLPWPSGALRDWP